MAVKGKELLGYAFTDAKLAKQALTHKSWANEAGEDGEDNERLEFLGDAVIEMVCSNYLYQRFPEADEGELTRMRSKLVRTEALAPLARGGGLDKQLLLGQGELKTGGRGKQRLLASAFEAVIGAIYLDGGYAAVSGLLEALFAGAVEEKGLAPDTAGDPKTALQEWIQQRADDLPRYEEVATSGPSHARNFTVAVTYAGERLAVGKGASKKDAEKQAAARALAKLRKGKVPEALQ